MLSLRVFPYALYFFLVSYLSTASRVPYPRSRTPRSTTVHYEIDLTWGPAAPDGHQRNVILMNGQPAPGPLLELHEGDNVEILVHNHLSFEETVHWHGIEQVGTPWSDGVPGLSQRGIQPGDSFLYKWTAKQYGTYWYHSHDRSHLMDGHYGPILIHPKEDEPSPFRTISRNSKDVSAMQKAELNPKLVTLADWSHFTSEEFFQIGTDAGLDMFCVDSVLINGKGQEDCLSRSEIDQWTNPALKPLLGNFTLTDKA